MSFYLGAGDPKKFQLHLTLVRMAKIKKQTKPPKTNASMDVEKGNTRCLRVQTGAATMEISARTPQKTKSDHSPQLCQP